MQQKNIYRLNTSKWFLERIIILIGGILIILGFILAWTINQNFIYLALFIGIMITNFTLTGYCPLAIILKKMKPSIETFNDLTFKK